jgi:hypothetical protein
MTQFNCMQLSKVERNNIGPTWLRNTCMNSPLAASQSLFLHDLEDFRRQQRLNNNDWKQAIQIINKIVYQTVSKY